MISHRGCRGEEAGVKMARSSVICSMTDGGQGKASEGQEIKAQLVVFFAASQRGHFRFFLFWSHLERLNNTFTYSQQHLSALAQRGTGRKHCTRSDPAMYVYKQIKKNWDSSSVCAALKGAGCIYIGQI